MQLAFLFDDFIFEPNLQKEIHVLYFDNELPKNRDIVTSHLFRLSTSAGLKLVASSVTKSSHLGYGDSSRVGIIKLSFVLLLNIGHNANSCAASCI